MIRDAQKDQLSQIKKALEVRFCKRISWEELADMAGIEPRTLKTYRMPIRPDVFAVDGLAARRRRQQMACATSVSPAYFKLTRGPTMLTQTVLYWSLPSPLAFCQGVTDAAHGKRAIVVNRPANADLDYGLKEGLRNANIIEPLILIIEDGANISSTLAPHFNNEVMHANRLAAVRLPQTQAVVLRTTGERSQRHCDTATLRHCEKYMSEFIEALSSTSGNVRLVLYMQDASITRNDSSGQIAVLVYDGALKTEEMQAYVSYRMLGREELGSTSLVRQLVTDFASFDVSLADNLIQMDKNEILNLPLSLTPLIAEDENRWNSVKWMGGSASLTSPAETHPLREWFVASHSSPLTAIGKDASDRRYWRACLKAISLWWSNLKRHNDRFFQT